MSPPWPGRSLRPLLGGRQASVRDVALIENDEDYLGLRLRSLVTERYKFTTYAGQPFGELFDLAQDPGELHNLWHDPDRRSLRHDLHVSLIDELVLTDSTLPRRLSHA